jgi:hypothetical protein
VVKDVDGAVLVAAGDETAVAAHVDAHAKRARVGAARLVGAQFARVPGVGDVPDDDAAVVRRGREGPAGLVEGERPRLAGLGGQRRGRGPLGRGAVPRPQPDGPVEPGAGGDEPVARRAHVVAPEQVRARHRLLDGERRLAAVVRGERGRAAGREERAKRGREAKDVGDVGCVGSEMRMVNEARGPRRTVVHRVGGEVLF